MVDSCYKKNGHICQLLEEEILVDDIVGEPHHLSGSLNEDRKKLRAAMKNIVDINALVERGCWKASSVDMEGESFLEECIALKEGMSKMKESYMNLIYDREHLLMVAEFYHCAFERETQESERIHSKWEATYDSLKRTQESLQESILQIDQLQRDLNVPHPPSCMEKNHVKMVVTTLDVLKEPHVEENHEEGVDLQMLVKRYEEENIGQALIDIERKDVVFLDMVNMYEDIRIELASKHDYLFMDWVDKYITKVEDQGCIRISCINRGLFDMHAWKETPYEITLWMVYSSPEYVADHIPYGSANKSPYSSIDWVDRDMFGMKTLGDNFDENQALGLL